MLQAENYPLVSVPFKSNLKRSPVHDFPHSFRVFSLEFFRDLDKHKVYRYQLTIMLLSTLIPSIFHVKITLIP